MDLEAAICREGHILVPVRSLAEALRAQVHWDPAGETVTIIKEGNTIKLVTGSREVLRNGERILLDLPAQVVNNRLVAPARFLAEALGAGVDYDLVTQTVRIISAPPEKPERVYNSSFPARVALTNNGRLWLVDGGRAGSAPVQVTADGAVEIVGWSPDGRWLAYLHYDSQDIYSAKPYLWVVKADGTGAFRVDPRPVWDTLDGRVPGWSPKANIIAFSTQGSGGDYARDGNLKIASLEDNGRVTVSELLPDKSGVGHFAWAPDGQSIAVSLPRTRERPLLIDQITLGGKITNLLTDGEPYPPGEYFYTRSATGFRWSPDGRYLAYYLEPGSPSLAADGVDIRVLDVQRPGRPLELGAGLKYPQWLAWSPDSSRLAYMDGYGRDATVDKRLYLADMRSGSITDCGSAGQVDTQPVWSPAEPYHLLFCRGKENVWWDGFKGGVLVPGQRIWQRTDTGDVKSLTSGPADTADYAPKVSPDGQNLLYLRLNRYDSGSLYTKPFAGGRETELIRGLTGGHGYYGNYYPEWVSVYWEEP
ncbi:MAG: stalk domain-containing protein [Thermoanaerobacterales bacterium]|nr:stalk domain-containing protein [Thermoanaerobacterales bacterium]